MKYLRFIILPSVICFLLNCSEDQNDAQGDTGWKGSTNEFNEKFQKNIDADSTTILFDPFFTTKESSSGSGFGLYNSKLFMEDHKGEIGFSSTLGQGTTFYLFLPLADLDERKEGVSKIAKRASREFTKKRKIVK